MSRSRFAKRNSCVTRWDQQPRLLQQSAKGNFWLPEAEEYDPGSSLYAIEALQHRS